MGQLTEAIASNVDIQKIQDIYALAIYGLVIFLKTLGYIKVTVADIFSRLCYNINPASPILVKTIQALNFCKKREWVNSSDVHCFSTFGSSALWP